MSVLAEHELDADPESFADIVCGVKTFDVRPAEQGFAVGDTLVFHEYDPAARTLDENQVEHVGAYTGRTCCRSVRYVLRGGRQGVTDGYIVMAIAPSVWTPSVATANGAVR